MSQDTDGGGLLRVYDSPSRDPHFNLALEEYLFRGSEKVGDVLVLYVNAPSVIIGRHQNPWVEADTARALRRGVPVVRRMSGGGAVYHDPGNLNIGFITPFRRGRRHALRRLFDPLVALLREAGAPVEQTRRYDLLVHGRKVSGNAQYSDLKRWLVHATLLFDARLDELHRLLRPSLRPLHSAGIESLRSRVANLARYLAGFDDLAAWKEKLVRRYAANAGSVLFREPDAGGRADVRQLALDKYRSWSWNFGKTPAFGVRGTLRVGGVGHDFRLRVEGGKVAAAEPSGVRESDNARSLLGCLPDTRLDVLLATGAFTPEKEGAPPPV